MSVKPLNAITINFVHGGKEKDKQLLEGCYFVPKGDGRFDFYDSKDELLQEDVSQSKSFDFHLDYFWTVPGRTFLISDTAAFGEWSNNDPRKKDSDEPEGESGSFQAQSGGSLAIEDAASSATA